jgi:hypothetical protein
MPSKEVKRFKEIKDNRDRRAKQELTYEVEYPILGLRYGIEWSPL